jgi:hypothetical protein
LTLISKSNHYGIDDSNDIPVTDFLFVCIYVALLIIVSVFPYSKLEIFRPRNELSLISLIRLGAAVALCFFFPGYAVISAVDKAHELRSDLTVLSACTSSLAISYLAKIHTLFDAFHCSYEIELENVNPQIS